MKLVSDTLASSTPAAARALNRGRVFFLLAVYFLLQTVLRVLVSDSAELDESEQLIFTQTLAWGYGAEPPLYPWLQIGLFQVFGTGILGLALLKNLLLFCICLFTYLAARKISGSERTALLAMLSLFLFPQITWESQRDLTHSVLATAAAAATFYAAVRTWKSGRALDYVLLGVCVGLGALSKHSYWLVALALAGAALSIPDFRQVILRRRMLLSVGAIVLLTAAHFHWLIVSHDLAFNRPRELLRSSVGGMVQTRGLALLSLIKCAIMLGGVISLVYLCCFPKAERGPLAGEDKPVRQWIWRTLLLTGLMALAVILATGIELRDRWFQPIVFLGAISAALCVGDRITNASEKRFNTLIACVGLVVLIVLPGIPLAASVTHRPTRLNAPYTALSAQLKAIIPQPDVIVAATRLIGGNLRLHFPQSTIVCPEFTTLTLPAGGRWLVVWDATKTASPPPPLIDLVRKLRPTSPEWKPADVQAPFLYTKSKRMKLGFIVFP